MLTSTRPAFADANCVSTHSAQFGDQMPSRSPGSRPRRIRPHREIVNAPLQLPVAPPYVLMRNHQRLALRVLQGCRVEHPADRGADQRLIAGALHIACLEFMVSLLI